MDNFNPVAERLRQLESEVVRLLRDHLRRYKATVSITNILVEVDALDEEDAEQQIHARIHRGETGDWFWDAQVDVDDIEADSDDENPDQQHDDNDEHVILGDEDEIVE